MGKVKAWQAAFNAGDLETVMAMFAPDVEFEMVGQGTMTDRTMIEGLHAYAIGIKSQLRSPNCSVEGNTVTCDTYEASEWHRIAGLPDTHYTSDIYVFNDAGLITKISATKAPESVQAEGEVLNAFIPWIAQNHPEAMPKLFIADKRFIYSSDNAALVLKLLQEWKNPSPTTAPTASNVASPSLTPAPTATNVASPSPTPAPASAGGASSSSRWKLILGLVLGGVLLLGVGLWKVFQSRA